MRCSNSFFITRREFPKDEGTISSKLLVRSGMILKNDNGIYTYLPFGLKVLQNLKKIISEEFSKINANEVLMPSLVDSDVFARTGRDELLKEELFNLTDKNNKLYSLCPTHEELFTYLARCKIKSYKDLHFSLFQISNKYRDESRSEYGLIRKKEFCMADAYSFDANDGGLDISYDKMYQAFKNIFTRMGLDTIVVRSSDESMKGISSEEFQIETPYGDNEVVKCTNCSYTVNREEAICKIADKMSNVNFEKMEKVHTPNAKTIKEVSEFLNIEEDKIIKSLVIKVDDKYKMILLKGRSELNVLKLKRLFKNKEIEIPSSYELEKIGTSVGFIGPVNSTMEIIADNEVKYMINAVCGSNKKDYHFINVVPGRDFRINKYSDLKLFDSNDTCPKCRSKCEFLHGVEIGHIFKLGDAYSKDYDLKYVDETNNLNYVHMGSYGIGLDRCLSTIVEKNHDDKGIIWPISVAPFKVAIIITNINDKDGYKYAFNLYDRLTHDGVETLIDDRKESAGVKFSDIDLIGIPLIVTIGKRLEEGVVELKIRSSNEIKFIKSNSIVDELESIIEKEDYLEMEYSRNDE